MRLVPLLLLLSAYAGSRPAAAGVRFGQPVIVHGAWNDSAGNRRDGNESMMDSFHSLGSDSFMFGQAIPSNASDLSPGEAVYVASTDSGASWHLADIRNPAAGSGWAPNGRPQALTGHGARRAPGTLRTLGFLKPRSPTSFGSASTFEYSLRNGELQVTPSTKGTSFTGLPRPLLDLTPSSEGKPFVCMGPKKNFFEPVASLALPDGSFLACSLLCFDDSPAITVFGSNASTRVPYLNGTVAGRSLVAWRSADGFDWKYVGTVTDAKDMMAEPTRSLGGNTEENDLALMADGKTIMIVMRTDGDCGCKQANGRGACGLYRPYSQSYSSDMGRTWSHASPIPGTGCARPRLLSLGRNRPMLMSGGRMCWANTTGLFLWVNPTGMPNQEWSRYSLSYAHNQGWTGDKSYLFDELINATNAGESMVRNRHASSRHFD